jgi:periplasmic divalent cation tolerance protein
MVVADFEYIVVFVTTATPDEAQTISDRLLESRKAACATIVPKVDSQYWWKGKIEANGESLLILKTKASVFTQVVDMVKQLHSYEVPEIIGLPIIDGNRDYLKWIDAEVQE